MKTAICLPKDSIPQHVFLKNYFCNMLYNIKVKDFITWWKQHTAQVVEIFSELSLCRLSCPFRWRALWKSAPENNDSGLKHSSYILVNNVVWQQYFIFLNTYSFEFFVCYKLLFVLHNNNRHFKSLCQIIC